MRFIILNIVLLTVGFRVQAESVSVDEMVEVISKMEQAYKKYDSYSMDIQHRSYVGDQTATPYETANGFYIKNKEFIESNILGVHTLQNTDLMLVVNPDIQIGILYNAQKQEVVKAEDLRTYLTGVASIEKTKVGGLYEYTFKYGENSSIEYFKFRLDSQNFLRRVSYLYTREQSQEKEDGTILKGKPKVEIIYSNILTKGVKNISGTMNQYLKSEGSSYKLIGKYANYEFSDNRIKK